MKRSEYIIVAVAWSTWLLTTTLLIFRTDMPLVTISFASPLAMAWFLTGIVVIGIGVVVLSSDERRKLRDKAMDLVEHPILITDSKGRIIWRNRETKNIITSDIEKQLSRTFTTIVEESNLLIRQVITTADDRQFQLRIKSLSRSNFLISFEPIAKRDDRSAFYDLFIRRIVHDMRNPLAGIIGHAANLKYSDPAHTTNWKQSADTIEAEAQRLSRLVDSMLFDARLEYVPLQLDVIDAADVIEESLYTLEDTAITQGKSIQLQLPHDEMPIYVDRDLMVRAIENLIDNSIKYTTQDGHIRVRVQRNNRNIVILIQDNGAGIEPDYLPDKIFEPLVRATKQKGGSGLGLSTVKKIVEMHHGRIQAKSTLGEGTTMQIILPVYEGDR